MGLAVSQLAGEGLGQAAGGAVFLDDEQMTRSVAAWAAASRLG